MNKEFFKTAVTALGLAGLALTASAQKVNELQEVSIQAPHAIKIDGKNFEWNQADFSVNKRTSISYIMANDEKNLYLVIKSSDVQNNMKIMAGGITLAVNADGKKKEKESITLTYPVINRGNMRGGPGGGGMRRIGGFGGGGGQQQSMAQRDSAMAAMQKTQLAQAKEIKINGFKNTTDTLISIYNEYSIKAFANIEKDNSFFYELQIPLESLGITADQEFAYNIKLNGLQLPGLDGPGGGGFGGGGGGGRGPGGGGGGRGPGGGGRGGFDFQALISPTDFWGKYTIKK